MGCFIDRCQKATQEAPCPFLTVSLPWCFESETQLTQKACCTQQTLSTWAVPEDQPPPPPVLGLEVVLARHDRRAPSLRPSPGTDGRGEEVRRAALGSTKTKPGESQGGIIEGRSQVLVERTPRAFWRAILGVMSWKPNWLLK